MDNSLSHSEVSNTINTGINELISNVQSANTAGNKNIVPEAFFKEVMPCDILPVFIYLEHVKKKPGREN